MTDYSDIPQVNALYLEQQQVQQAIQLIDAGGTMTYFSVAPPPYSGEPTPPEPPPMMGMMAAGISLPEPATPELMAALRAQLVIRDNEIIDQLAALGVTNPPAKVQ